MLLKQWPLLNAILPSVYAQGSSEPLCQPIGGPQDGLLITPDCLDPDYNNPVIDIRSNETTPAPHYKVSGHFENTTIRFNFHFPLKDALSENIWANRFFQFVYPTQEDSADNTTIGFGLDSGAYVVQITGTQGYRAEAASAKFSKQVAAEYYGLNNGTEHRIFGYIYGASGGSLQVVGALENTVGVWDGGVPIVQAIPASIGISHTLRPMAGLVLQNKSREIEHALRPGGSGDPYASLNDVQRDCLREALRLGLPMASLEDFYYAVDRTPLAQMRQTFVGVDSTYVDEFWTKDGYLGVEESALGDLFRSAVIEFNATVVNIEQDDGNRPRAFKLEGVPTNKAFHLDWDTTGYRFTVCSTNGTDIGTLSGRFNYTTSTATFDAPESEQNDVSLYPHIQANTTLRVSNREFIALHAWYKYQVPGLSDDRGYIGFDQFRTSNGSSIHPQRSFNTAKTLAKAAAGGADHSGLINGKVVVIQTLLDAEALPWWAHWYRMQVQDSLGERFDDNYRLWYNSHAAHAYTQPENKGLLLGFEEMYQQALRDLSKWVEEGVTPPPTSNYTITSDNGVSLPEDASQRGGIQPTVNLKFSHNSTLNVAVGEEVLFTVVAEAPPNTGKIVFLDWDLVGAGDFVREEVVEPAAAVTLQRGFTYTQSGNYIAVVRAASERTGNAKAAYSKVMNLGRVNVRVV